MKAIKILLVEDDQLDIMDVQRTLSKQDIVYDLQVAKNGEEALMVLGRGVDSDNLPDIVLVDINMPKMNGLELLQAIRSTDSLKQLKIFIITTSDEQVDKMAAVQLGVSGYIIKPLKLNSPNTMDAFNLMIDLMNFKSKA